MTFYQDKIREQRRANGEVVEDVPHDLRENHMLMMRILGPIITFVNRPWKVSPFVGIFFLVCELIGIYTRCIPLG